MNHHRSPATTIPQLEPLEARRLLAISATITLNTQSTFQTIDGFGAAMIGWKNVAEYQTSGFYDQLVNDLGATTARIPIWPTFESANDNNDPDVINWSGFNSSAIGPHLRFFQRLKERGVNTFFATAWVSPFWMKTSGNFFHGGSMRADRMHEYGEYLAAFVMAAKRDFDIDIAAVSLQNEPYFIEPYESAVYDPVRYVDTLHAVQRQFERYNLPTRLLVTEDLGYFPRVDWYLDHIVSDPRIDRSRLIIGSHYARPADLPLLAQRSEQYGMPVWMTEVSGKPDTWSEALSTLEELHRFLTIGNARAYNYWQWTDVPSASTQALMSNGVPNNKYHAVKHYANWVRPGAVRGYSHSNNSSVGGSIYTRAADAAQTIVLFNKHATEPANLSFAVTGSIASSFRVFQSTATSKGQLIGSVSAGGNFSLTIPAQSMVTLYSGPDRAPRTGSAGQVETIAFRADPSFTNTIRQAALAGDLATGQAQATTSNVDIAFGNGWTPLFNAAASPYANAPAIIDHLVSLGGNAGATDSEGRTPLHIAAANPLVRWGVAPSQAVARVHRLIAAGASVHALDALGRTPLHHAAMQIKFSFQGPDDRIQDGQVVQALIDAGADVGAVDSTGKTPLDYALQHRNIAAARALQGLAPDNVPPTVTGVKFVHLNGPAIRVTFSEDINPSFNAHDLTLTRNGTTLDWRQLQTQIISAPGAPTVALLRPSTGMAVGQWQLSMPAEAVYDRVWNRSAAINRTFDVHLPGDMNGDGAVNNLDIAPFVLALTSPSSYALQYPTIAASVVGDLNADDALNNLDIAPFVALLTGSRPAVRSPTPPPPAPASARLPVARTPVRAGLFADAPVENMPVKWIG
ncbi:MAG TPA: hypothetical protein PKB10_04520 [Tepidisphaeraceae bacterium]|nr:hypothetical protein [Tepidisphaeraceae bacterium]